MKKVQNKTELIDRMETSPIYGNQSRSMVFEGVGGTLISMTTKEQEEYMEANGGPENFTLRRVYDHDDLAFLEERLAAAKARWPSRRTTHQRCEHCLDARPCAAIRVFMETSEKPTNLVLYVWPGCSTDVLRSLVAVQKKIQFLRDCDVDAFIALAGYPQSN
jgi:hypothetical protein